MKKPQYAKTLEVIERSFTETFTVEEGMYCVTAFLDMNKNKKLDRKFIGIPKEPMGFNRDYIPKFIPSFSGCEQRFDSQENTITIRMGKY